MSEISPDTLIDGRYKVISRLGTGGMADVFCAEDQQLGRKVAVKLLHRRFAEDPDFVERFRREAHAAAGLQHPNVVSVYDRGSYDGTYYIAMEYLPGRTLKQVIRQEAPIEPIRAIDMTIQILKAARFAHRRGVIHRDLKPHNVMLGDGDIVKVTDFGIARAGASDMTETGSIMGTAQYLSPEQAQGHTVTETSDLYSVGVVLYELLTGRVPFDADAAVTIALKHVSEAPINPTALNAAIPPELEQVVLWSLNKDPAHRPADADQLIAALEQARAAILARSGGQLTADMPALALAAAVVDPAAGAPSAAAQVAAADVAPEAAPVGPPPAPVAPAGKGRSRRWWWALVVLLLAVAAVAAFLLTRPAQVTVPTVVSEKLAIATTQLQNAGLTQGVINVQDRHPFGTVIKQNPLGGVKADKGSTVTLTVSSGPGTVQVPSVAGLSQQQARQKIARAHLRVDRTAEQPSNSLPAGSPIGTDPTAGQQLQAGSGVTLIVSSGQAPVTVPDVKGLTKADATAKLTALGLTVNPSTQESSTDRAGTVISQSVTGKAPAGSTVGIVVARAPATGSVPDVSGQDAATAAATLKADGFTVGETRKDVTTQGDDGKVLSQSPQAGTKAGKGSKVTIMVGRYRALTTPTTGSTPAPKP